MLPSRLARSVGSYFFNLNALSSDEWCHSSRGRPPPSRAPMHSVRLLAHLSPDTTQLAWMKRSRARSSASTWVCCLSPSLLRSQLIGTVTDLFDNSGTTNSAVAVMEGKTPRIIENAEGRSQCSFLLSNLEANYESFAQAHERHHQSWPLRQTVSD